MKILNIFDFDATLMDSPEPEEGKKMWKNKTGEEYPYEGWWGRPESLNNDILNIKPFKSILGKLNDSMNNINTHTIILTNRISKLKPQLEKILKDNNISVDELITKENGKKKGDVILDYINKHTDLKEINVYDDMEKNIVDFKSIRNKIPNDIKFNIYKVKDSKSTLIENNSKLISIINDEIIKLNS